MLSNISGRFIENVDSSIQDAWKYFYDIIYMSLDLYVPVKTQKRHLKGNLPCEKKIKNQKIKSYGRILKAIKMMPNEREI